MIMYSVMPKVYKVDYDFLINNYLDKSLWGKEWNVYVYLDHIFSISLYSIEIWNMQIYFKIKHSRKNYSNYTFVYYKLNHPEYNIDVLKKQINGQIYYLMCSYLINEVWETKEYKYIDNVYYDELEILKDIAKSRCDYDSISNPTIIENYIDTLQDKSVLYNIREDYVQLKKYMIDTDLLLLFCNATGDTTRLKEVQSNADKLTEIDDLLQQVDEVKESIENNTYFNEYGSDLPSI